MPQATIIADSVSPEGVRLTTVEATMHRFVLAELNTHRVMCLAGDTQLYFDHPRAVQEGRRRVQKLSLAEFHRKWHDPTPHPRNKKGHHDLSLKDRLGRMHLRSLDEETGEFGWTHVVDVWESGEKLTFKVTLEDGKSISCSKDHLFFTEQGWQTLEEATGLAVSEGNIVSWQADSRRFATNGSPAYTDPVWLQTRGRNLEVDFLEHHGARNDLTVLRWAAIRSIEIVGVQMTYDIQVLGPWHNFVADGVVVHNSRNSASSRAIPVAKQLQRVLEDPALPVEFGTNQPGMQAAEALQGDDHEAARAVWLSARDAAVEAVSLLAELGVHKQVSNRLLEPFMWHTVIVSATDWEGFWEQRCSPLAQPEIRVAAEAMRAAHEASTPLELKAGEWHTPYVRPDEEGLGAEVRKRISVARCARVSYLTHAGQRDLSVDEELYLRLVTAEPPHWSPLEHVARPIAQDEQPLGNLRGWRQLRHEIEQSRGS